MRQTGHKPLWRMGWSVGLLMAVTLFLHGCAGKEPVAGPSGPVSVSRPRPTPAPTPAPVDVPSDAPLDAPSPPPPAGRESVPVPKEGKAAGTLLACARQNVRAGQFAKAEMTLERALRLEPRNARLWQEMAQVKYGQKDYEQVVQFSIKSNSLAGKDYDLIRQNWLLMEKAYLKLGKPDKAKQARSKAM
ncbi:MAG: tetratricopeptide repeat protein [Desulfobulbaceae bacterium]|nr:tetratricopeptide repeat protein [Desulfobulbaceae bacterium]HIJ91578.1 tetratricopeptide repeat protein [Deltaproteobacteria bacterium]